MIPAVSDPSGDLTAAWGWKAWALMALLFLAIRVVWVVLDAKQPFPTPNAAPAPERRETAPVRARTAAGPALRVHLCTRQCGRPVARPGEACYPVCQSPVHEAERILRETARGGAT